MKQLNDVEAFLISLEKEKKGYNLYKHAAEKAVSTDIRNALLELAKMELEHIEAFKKIIEEKKENKEFISAYDNDDATKYISRLIHQDIFKGITEDALAQGHHSIRELINTAMEIEKNTVLLYTEMKNLSSNPEAIAIFNRLLKEEKIHYVMLAEMLDGLKE